MANMFDFYYRQKVLEDELDSAFEALQEADQNLILDTDFAARFPFSNKADYGGIVRGLQIFNPGGTRLITVSPGTAYDEQGRRVALSEQLYLNITNDGVTTAGEAGVPNGATTPDPALGNEIWVAIFLVYDNVLSDARYDGYNTLVYFNRAESFHFEVVQGTEAAIDAGTRPARQSEKTLLGDVKIANPAGTVTVGVDFNINTARQECFLDVAAGNAPNKRIYAARTVRDAIRTLLDYYNDHIAGLVDLHDSGDIEYIAGQTWADGATVAATRVAGALDEIVGDLAQTQAAGAGSSGTDKVGAEDVVGSAGLVSNASPYSLPQGTLQAALADLVAQVNARVFRGGDDGIGGALTPASDGEDLGSAANSWDVLARDLTVKGALKSNLVPDGNATRSVGSAANRLANLRTETISVDKEVGDYRTLDFKAQIESGTPGFRVAQHKVGLGTKRTRLNFYPTNWGTLQDFDHVDIALGDEASGDAYGMRMSKDGSSDRFLTEFGDLKAGFNTAMKLKYGPDQTGNYPGLYLQETVGAGEHARYFQPFRYDRILLSLSQFIPETIEVGGNITSGWETRAGLIQSSAFNPGAPLTAYCQEWPEEAQLIRLHIDWETDYAGASDKLRVAIRRAVHSESGPGISYNDIIASGVSTYRYNNGAGGTGRRRDSISFTVNNTNFQRRYDQLFISFASSAAATGDKIYAVQLDFGYYTVCPWSAQIGY